VWSYAQSVAWLFPELERSARRIEYTLEVDAKGSEPIRSQRIFGLGATEGKGLEFAHPAVDGQMGSLLRLHREWRFSGDDAFLRECWPAAVRAMDFALREWDTDKDGFWMRACTIPTTSSSTAPSRSATSISSRR
jgi:D-arabinan exo beta-(1,2)-arabinofuranosidase (non-reducing end)